jgi:hypothetical protein
MYIISDQEEKRFVTINSNNQIELSTDKNKAYKYEDKNKAENVITNNLQGRFKTLNITFRVMEVSKSQQVKKEKSQFQINYIEDIADQEIQPTLNKKFNHDLFELAKLVSTLPNDLDNEKANLTNQLIHICRALTDLNHHRLLNGKMSASQRCNRDTLTTKLIEKRQEIKDKILLVEILEARLNGEDIAGRIDGLDNRLYAPRELTEMFENNEMPDFDMWWSGVVNG